MKYRKYILAAIIILAAFLILFRLTMADIQHDDAIYSFRGVDYFDYVDSQLQTTPITWFGSIPWWSRLSFHDAPPLVFLIQFIFFKLFGISVLASRLPFALAGIGSVFLVYLLAKQLYNEKVALLASLVLAVSSFHVWLSKIGYLEPIAIFFILLTLYLFLKGLKNNKLFIWFGVALGLTMLTKYTIAFIFPAIFLYLLIKNRKVLINKYFVIAIVIAVLIFSPVLFYNYKVWQTRGHFDLQLAGLFGQDMSDWPGMSGGAISGEYLQQAKSVWQQFSSSYSLSLYLVLIVSLVYILINLTLKFKDNKNLFLILLLFFATVQFAFVGVNDRFISLFIPFLAITVAVGLVKLYDFTIAQSGLTIVKKFAYIIVLTVLLLTELLYTVNTNILREPIGQPGKHFSNNRWENTGFNQLEKHLVENGYFDFKGIRKITDSDELGLYQEDLIGSDVFIYDGNLNWFSVLWYFSRWKVYSDYIIASAPDIGFVLGDIDWFEFFKENGVKNVFFVKGANDIVYDEGLILNEEHPEVALQNRQISEVVAQVFERKGATKEEIFNLNDELVFELYKVELN
tara:strand:- start:3770 stop:5479 length:1710 start_codon:yes stop_codon:yes gene_type:complete